VVNEKYACSHRIHTLGERGAQMTNTNRYSGSKEKNKVGKETESEGLKEVILDQVVVEGHHSSE
jgi:hypothetical protein